MKLINRSALSITPKAAFIEWVSSLNLSDEDALAYLATPLGEHEASVYLVSEVESEAEFLAELNSCSAKVLTNEFSAWDEFGDDWPAGLEVQTVTDWFDVKLAVVAFDLANEPLMMADLDRLDS